MAVSAAPVITVAAGVVGGGALIAAAVLARPGRHLIVTGLVTATLPFAMLTWWAIIPPLLTVAAFVIGIAIARGSATGIDARTGASNDLHPAG